MAELLQLVCKAVNIKWKLHTVYRPQSSRMTERMNWIIKVTLAKWVQETGTPLDGRASISINEDQNDPTHRYSPYEIVFGSPPPLIWEVKGNLLQRGGMEVLWQLEQLGKVIHDITLYVQKERIPFSLGATVHP